MNIYIYPYIVISIINYFEYIDLYLFTTLYLYFTDK